LKGILSLSVLLFILYTGSFTYAQKTEFYLGDKIGLSLTEGSASLAVGPVFEVVFLGGRLGVGTELGVDTDALVEWTTYAKYFFKIRGTKITPYTDFGLWFANNGPFFSLRAGGGSYFPISKNLYIPADIQFGLIFANGAVFHFAISTGLRYRF